ncbi:uncharacterized protein LOC134845210 [Symsagittifera roscoffensis]|uniref:uncharacterized protein LOC134845210 n=1 Tax=Symsagittifera roscoffensis TaxID=84072 RepID=UPI00307B8BB9
MQSFTQTVNTLLALIIVSCPVCGDDVKQGTFFCINCGGEAGSCCNGVMGMSFCCSDELLAIQTSFGIATKLLDSQSVATCQSNDNCPTVANQIVGVFVEEANGDYCCPIYNMCCPFKEYFWWNLKMLSYSFGGPAIFFCLVGVMINAMCCCCCCCCCGKKSTTTQLVA